MRKSKDKEIEYQKILIAIDEYEQCFNTLVEMLHNTSLSGTSYINWERHTKEFGVQGIRKLIVKIYEGDKHA